MTRPTVTADPAMLHTMRVCGRVLHVTLAAGLAATVVLAGLRPDGGSITGAVLLAVAFVLCVVNNHAAGFGLTWANHVDRTDCDRPGASGGEAPGRRGL